MLQDGFQSSTIDMKARALVEQQVDARRLIEATQTALSSDGDLLSEEERSRVTCLMSEVGVLAAGTDHNIIKNAIEALARGTEEFAARRMDRGVRLALTGRRLDEIV